MLNRMKMGERANTLASYLQGALQAPFAAPVIRESIRNTPTSNSIGKPDSLTTDQLIKGFDAHIDDIRPGASVTVNGNRPTPKGATVLERLTEVLNNPTAYAGSSAPSDKTPYVNINPNADRALYAHELGHIASQNTDFGRIVANMRHDPNTKKALLGALILGSGATAALQEGDDDMDDSLAYALAASAPTLIDEGLATRHGLNILNKSGLRATMGQRGKLAGGLLSYLAAPVAAAAAANVVGNQLDSDG